MSATVPTGGWPFDAVGAGAGAGASSPSTAYCTVAQPTRETCHWKRECVEFVETREKLDRRTYVNRVNLNLEDGSNKSNLSNLRSDIAEEEEEEAELTLIGKGKGNRVVPLG